MSSILGGAKSSGEIREDFNCGKKHYKHTESLQGPCIRISGFTREPVYPKTNASNSIVFILCQCFRKNSQR